MDRLLADGAQCRLQVRREGAVERAKLEDDRLGGDPVAATLDAETDRASAQGQWSAACMHDEPFLLLSCGTIALTAVPVITVGMHPTTRSAGIRPPCYPVRLEVFGCDVGLSRSSSLRLSRSAE
jgi:hypothetical protein